MSRESTEDQVLENAYQVMERSLREGVGVFAGDDDPRTRESLPSAVKVTGEMIKRGPSSVSRNSRPRVR